MTLANFISRNGRAKAIESFRNRNSKEATKNISSSFIAAPRVSAGLGGFAILLCTAMAALPGTADDSTSSKLGWHVWQNFLVKSSGNVDNSLYAVREMPGDWTYQGMYSGNGTPKLAWSETGLLRQFSNYTAISQANGMSRTLGQMPVTLLSRRHAYMRGHSTPHFDEGNRWRILTNYAGRKVWFCDKDNNVVTATVKASFGGFGTVTNSKHNADFVVLLFEDDLPATVANIQVCFAKFYYEEILNNSWNGRELTSRPVYCDTMFSITQVNKMGVLPIRRGFEQNCGIGGDSGSPTMLPVKDKLVMFGGATTTGLGGPCIEVGRPHICYDNPEPEFCADTFVEWAVETLNERFGIDSHNPAYNVEYADLSEFGLTNGSSVTLTTNGLPYFWLKQYGLPTDGSADHMDCDSDGLSALQEWKAGTNPIDPNSVLSLEVPSFMPAGVLLQWNSQSNCTYWVERADALTFPMNWTALEPFILAQSSQATFVDTSAASGGSAFYRVMTDATHLDSPVPMEAPQTVPAARVTLRWNSVANKVYAIERATTPAGPFSVIQSNIIGQAGVTTFVDTNNVAAGPFFYRVGVQ